MRKTVLASTLAVAVLPFLAHSPQARADFVQKNFACPRNNFTVVPTGSNISVSDVIVSANKNQTVTLKFAQPGNVTFMRVYLKANETVVSNFQGGVEGDNDQAVKMDCAGTTGTTVSVTIVGNGSL